MPGIVFAFFQLYCRSALSDSGSALDLCHNFFREVVLSLLDTFAGLETDELFDLQSSTVGLADLLKILAYRLLAVLSLYIDLVVQADFLELLVFLLFSGSLLFSSMAWARRISFSWSL